MNVMTILGSPRKNGNTARALDWFEEELTGLGHRADRVRIVSHDLEGCLGCMQCKDKPDETGCVQKDDGPALFERLLAADAVLFAAPLYCWGFPAQMKAFIDRSVCLAVDYGTATHRSLAVYKPAALLVTCAGPIEENADLIQKAFERYCWFTRMRHTGSCVLSGCSGPDDLGDGARARVAELARGLVS